MPFHKYGLKLNDHFAKDKGISWKKKFVFWFKFNCLIPMGTGVIKVMLILIKKNMDLN